MTHPLASLLNARAITALYDTATEQWHNQPAQITSSDDFPAAVRALHHANFELWHLEDQARAPHASDHQIADVKHGIDRVNQRRNDLMERCDTLLLDALAPYNLPAPQAPLHSESPGLILDRLSILSLKIFHTREEMQRIGAPEGHVARNSDRLRLLEEQRSDLTACLHDLWSEIIEGKRRSKLYRQLKMYNDPALNPAVYNRPRP